MYIGNSRKLEFSFPVILCLLFLTVFESLRVSCSEELSFLSYKNQNQRAILMEQLLLLIWPKSWVWGPAHTPLPPGSAGPANCFRD